MHINAKKRYYEIQLVTFLFFMHLLGWRIWDKSIRFLWPALPEKCQLQLWQFIDSEIEIKDLLTKVFRECEGAIIQVGSNDGISNDPLYNFIESTSHEAFLIEPVNFLAERLRTLHEKNNNVKVLEYAIHRTRNMVNFYFLDEASKSEMGSLWKSWYDQIGSFKKEHLLKYAKQSSPFIREKLIVCKTLDKVVEDENIDEVMILHIDAEGFDLEVLKSINISKILPNFIMLEHKHVPLLDLMIQVKELFVIGYEVKILHDDICFYRKTLT